MANPTFQKLIDDIEVAVSAWESCIPGEDSIYAEELDFYTGLRSALDAYYVEVARR